MSARVFSLAERRLGLWLVEDLNRRRASEIKTSGFISKHYGERWRIDLAFEHGRYTKDGHPCNYRHGEGKTRDEAITAALQAFHETVTS